jgi:hypothetical protein
MRAGATRLSSLHPSHPYILDITEHIRARSVHAHPPLGISIPAPVAHAHQSAMSCRGGRDIYIAALFFL